MGASFCAQVHTGSEAHPASYTVGTVSFPGVKRPGRSVDHTSPSSAEVNERVELCLYSASGPTWPFLGLTLPFTDGRDGIDGLRAKHLVRNERLAVTVIL